MVLRCEDSFPYVMMRYTLAVIGNNPFLELEANE